MSTFMSIFAAAAVCDGSEPKCQPVVELTEEEKHRNQCIQIARSDAEMVIETQFNALIDANSGYCENPEIARDGYQKTYSALLEKRDDFIREHPECSEVGAATDQYSFATEKLILTRNRRVEECGSVLDLFRDGIVYSASTKKILNDWNSPRDNARNSDLVWSGAFFGFLAGLGGACVFAEAAPVVIVAVAAGGAIGAGSASFGFLRDMIDYSKVAVPPEDRKNAGRD